jgi:hypothetical protein
MSVISLKELCQNRLVEEIGKLPCILKEEIIKKSLEENKREIINDLNKDIPYIITYMIERKIREIRDKRKDKEKEIKGVSKELHYLCLNSTELIFNLIEPILMDKVLKEMDLKEDNSDSDSDNSNY